jgi:hypothetical protein
MTRPSDEFRDQLLRVEPMSPSLREAYRKEIDAMVNPPLKTRAAVVGAALALALAITAVLIVRAIIVYHVRGLMLVSHATLATALLFAAGLIFRDLQKRKHTPRAASLIAGVFYGASGTITVIALLLGLGHSSEPKTLYGVFYVFVFYFACAMWKLQTHITDASLASREQSLRVECRLMDLTEKMAG